MKRYNTSIKKLIQAKNDYICKNIKEPIFLSDWDVDNIEFLPTKISNIDLTLSMNKYYFLTDEAKIKPLFVQFCKDIFNYCLHEENFLIGSNGTSSLMLSLLGFYEMGLKRALIFTPMYFTVLNMLDNLDFTTFEHHLKPENNFKIEYGIIEDSIKHNRPEIIIISDPVFGRGVSIKNSDYRLLAEIAQKYGCWLLIDAVYSGMEWNAKEFIINDKIFDILGDYENIVVIESISKRLFLNGIKHSLIYGNSLFMRRISRISIYTIGSICVTQLDMFKKIYSTSNYEIINDLIKKNIQTTIENYSLIKTILKDRIHFLSNCESSYFCLCGIPNIEKEEDINYAIKILELTGVLTTPHSRYLLKSDLYYFRINLLLEKTKLISGVAKVASLLSY